MPYKYFPAILPVTKPPNETYIEDFQQFLDDQFSNASTVFTIQEEYPYASSTYRNVTVRINHAIASLTSDNLGDDFKQILFKDLDHPAQRGSLYQFDNNYWMCINTEKYKNLASSITVRRCNHVLRWMDSTGAVYTSPTIIENYDIRENRNYSTATSAIVMPSGFIDVITQFNDTTNKIKQNQRFLIGVPNNWTAYRVMGGGINNFNNIQTFQNTPSGTLKLTLEVVYVNPDTDDLINGIADYKQANYTITLNATEIRDRVGNTFQLTPTVKLNGETVSRRVIWSSADTAVATVNSNGLVTLVALGSTTVTGTLEGNTSVYARINVTVLSSPVTDWQIVVSPSSNTILEGDTVTYDVRLWVDGVLQGRQFAFSVSGSDVPTANYQFTSLTGNTFSVKNLMRYPDKALKIHCDGTGSYVKDIDLILKGAW